MTCPEPQQHEGGGRNQRSPLPSSNPPRATAGFPRAGRGLSPSLIPTDLIPVSQATSPRDEPLRTLHAGRASGSWEGAASPSSHSTSPGGSHCTFATVSGPACCSYFFFFSFFFSLLLSMPQSPFTSRRLEAAWWGALQGAPHSRAAPAHLPFPLHTCSFGDSFFSTRGCG